MNKPKRIQRKRTKGWRMPENAVYVGRPSKWGNPFKIIPGSISFPDAAAVVELFNELVENEKYQGPKFNEMMADIHELRGKDLVCWCSIDQPCHADVLLELANRGE